MYDMLVSLYGCFTGYHGYSLYYIAIILYQFIILLCNQWLNKIYEMLYVVIYDILLYILYMCSWYIELLLTHRGLVMPYDDIDLGQQSTLAQVMACCLTSAGHYLSLLLTSHQRCSVAFTWEQLTISATTHEVFRNYTFKIVSSSRRGEWVYDK